MKRSLFVCAVAVSLLGPAVGAVWGQEETDPQSASRGKLVKEVRALSKAEVAGAAEDTARWERIRARTGAFLARFPDDRDAAEMGFNHGLAAMRLGRMGEAVEDFTAFLARHPEDPRHDSVLYLRGLAYAERFEDVLALTDLTDVQSDHHGPPALRDRAAYARAQILLRRGDASEAIALLRAVVEGRSVDDPLATKADRDLRDLVQIGGPAPGLTALAGRKERCVVIVLRRPDEAVGLEVLGESERAVAQAPEGTAALLDLQVAGFDDEAAKGLRPPALPRAYVVGTRHGSRVILGAGLRRGGLTRVVNEGTAGGSR